MEKTYKVSFWFNDGNGTADEVVYVTTDKAERRDITAVALKQLGSYPRSYSVLVEPTEGGTVKEYFVVSIINSEKANKDAWYYNRNHDMHVVYLRPTGRYITAAALGGTSTYGEIDKQFCRVITSFKNEEKGGNTL